MSFLKPGDKVIHMGDCGFSTICTIENVFQTEDPEVVKVTFEYTSGVLYDRGEEVTVSPTKKAFLRWFHTPSTYIPHSMCLDTPENREIFEEDREAQGMDNCYTWSKKGR